MHEFTELFMAICTHAPARPATSTTRSSQYHFTTTKTAVHSIVPVCGSWKSEEHRSVARSRIIWVTSNVVTPDRSLQAVLMPQLRQCPPHGMFFGRRHRCRVRRGRRLHHRLIHRCCRWPLRPVRHGLRSSHRKRWCNHVAHIKLQSFP